MQISLAENKKELNLEQASEYVRKASNGKILSAKTTQVNGVATHRIQVLTESGRVKVFQVPAIDKSTRNKPSQRNYNNSPNNYYSQDRSSRETRNTTSRSRYSTPSSSRRGSTPSNSSTSRSTSSNTSKGDSQKK